MKEELKQKLEEYSYTVEEDLNSIQVQLLNNLYADIKFKDNGKIEIVELFKGWSLVFGFVGFSFKGNFNFLSGLLLLIIFLHYTFDLVDVNILIGFIGIFFVNLFLFFFYLIKFENFKIVAYNIIQKLNSYL